MTSTPAMIETDKLSVSVPSGRWLPFGKTPTLDILVEVSIALRVGEIVCMVGESGSGKTTFGRALVGLVKPSAGRIALDGVALPDFTSRSFRRVRSQSALLFQDPVTSFNPRQRIGSIIAEPRHITHAGSTKREDIVGLARKAGLAEQFLSRFPHALSGGQARRAAVARALSVVPRLIIADEPTAGLDVSVQGGVLNLFLDIRDEFRTTFLVITHNLSVARHIADRIVILYLGRVVESGPAEEIFRNPQHPYTKALLDSEPVPDPAHRREEPPVIGEVPSLAARPKGCEFHTRCRFAQDRCRTEAPIKTDVSPDHQVACHFPLAATKAASIPNLRLVSR
ncbi:ABC transporter ATP-binding protein [Rhizobiaceae bacterium n13]|uniref:ABC transporter ATP-binding protein n=1 Tax=Ferirhizobium litorale TaxID=2927786 RepID=A0AAE3U436_9HYPH|nr:ABC transporter ATP-binding protein [Fererhizobium litorale]MDI7862123.1 ABC transporter ATP-binding protein [Fererhizobium litorale]MDI7922604.1 ABC transporter ATP-binding protein [Fererhizobium litorale]